MKSMQGWLMAGALALGAAGFAGTAQARSDVFWSVGVGSPGISLGVGNLPPPVVYAPPVYMQPAPVYVPPPAYYAPPPVYRPARYYYGPPPRHWERDRWRHHRHWNRDRDWRR